MRAKWARIAYEVVNYGMVFCLVAGFICTWGAASTSDEYTLIEKSGVPGNIDMKMFFAGLLFFLLGAVLYVIRENVDFSARYDIDRIPLYYAQDIKKESASNVRFNYQLERCLQCFYNGIFGELSIGDTKANEESIGRGKGRIIGEYRTSEGNICIVTNADRTRTEVYFVNSY